MANNKTTKRDGGPKGRGPKRDGKGPHGLRRKNQNKDCPKGNK